MMMRWRSLRRVGLVILCAVIVAGSAPQPAPAQDAIGVVVDGLTLRLDPPPLLIGGRVFVPLRGLFERMGALVEWKPISRTAIIVRSGTFVSLRVGDRTASVNRTALPLDVPAQMVHGRVFVPLRFVGEALGARVLWRAADHTVVISTSRTAPAKPEQPAAADQARPIVSVQVPTGPAPPLDLGEPVPVERGKVVVQPVRDEFGVGDRIGVTIANGLDGTIYSDDFKTDCSIVTLERRVGAGWEPITGCTLGRPTMTIAIGSGRGRTTSINPGSIHLRKTAGAAVLAFGPGTYRIRFTYRFTASPSAEHTVYSAPFTIR